MGFDVTFHPCSKAEIQRYVFDVCSDYSVADARVRELSSNPSELELLRRVYGCFPEWTQTACPVANSFAFAAAALAGFLHPYWYARDAAITFLAEGEAPELRGVFSGLNNLPGSPFASLRKPGRSMIFGNESASGFIPPEQIETVQASLDALHGKPGRGGLSLLEAIMDEDAVSSLRGALDYCRERKLGMIEASDVVVPVAGHCITRYANLRAPFLRRLSP